ncbi:MAG TPA: TonB-dependent receptor [Caulobacteraceae bacterium]|jgi:hypothetical protein
MRSFALAAAVLCAVASSAHAQTAPAQDAASPSAAASVTPYPAAFFAPMGPETAYDMILRIPGFTFDDGSTVRGFAGAVGNVLIDGQRPTSKTDDVASVLQRLRPGAVARIDLIRGSAPGIDMGGKTVVANVILKQAGGFSGDVQLSAYKPEGIDIDPGVKVEGAWRLGDATLDGSLSAARYHDDQVHEGTHEIFGPTGQRLDTSALAAVAPNEQYLGTLAYAAPLWGGQFKANLLLEDQPYQDAFLDNFRVAGREDERDRRDQTDAELGLHFTKDLRPDLNLELIGLQHVDRFGSMSTFVTPSDNQLFLSADSGGESIARAVLHWRPGATVTLDAGGEFAFNWLKTRTAFDDNGTAIAIPAANVLVREKRGEAFTTATWRPAASVALEAGVRVEESTITSTGDTALSKTLVYPKPRLVATWTPDAGDQVRLRVEREVGQLDFTSFVAAASLNANGVAAGNPNLLPQQDWAFEAAYDRHFWKDGVVSLTVRHLELSDVVDRVPVQSPSGFFDEPGNIGGGSENDIVGAFSVPLDRFFIPGGVFRGLETWRFSQVSDPTTGEARPISGLHPFDGELHFSQDLPRWRLNWGIDSTIGYTERYYRFDEIDTNRKKTWASLFVVYKARPDLTIRAELDNLSGRTYTVTRQVFDGPRDAFPLDFFDVQQRRWGLLSYLRIRKTFG